jgi:hypothetical protein
VARDSCAPHQLKGVTDHHHVLTGVKHMTARLNQMKLVRLNTPAASYVKELKYMRPTNMPMTRYCRMLKSYEEKNASNCDARL